MTTILHGGLFDGLEIQMPPQGQVLFMADIFSRGIPLVEDDPPLCRHVYVQAVNGKWHFSHVQH
jgi:hypothetical protein